MLQQIIQFSIILSLFYSNVTPFGEGILESSKSSPKCEQMDPALIEEIRSYQSTVNTIIQTAVSGEFKGRVFNEVAKFADTFGTRWAGSNSLESSIDYMLDHMTSTGMSNVHSEPVATPYKWTRGVEWAELLTPLSKKLNILGQVPTVSTPPEGIQASVIVVSDLEELETVKDQVPGKFVLFDYNYTSYNDALPYRRQASSIAAKYGAVATLVRSTTPFSINSPHSSGVQYDPDLPRIPTAALTVEDAALLRRYQEAGKNITLKLVMQNTLEAGTMTRNAMGELPGTQFPDEIIIVAGHVDSVDVGTGALDDGAGVFMATEAIALLKFLNLVPRRTTRAVLFTAEEMGLVGATEYVDVHKDELERTVLALEADQGAFNPKGLDFAGSEEAACILKEILNLLGPINATQLLWFNQTTPVSSDIYMLQLEGVPAGGLNNEGQWDYYFWFHHSEGDTMSVLKTEELDANLAVWAAISYVVADLSKSLPREGYYSKET